MSEFFLVTFTNIVTLLSTILMSYFTVITRIPAWAEVADDEDYIPVPTFQSAFTEALGAADWTISSGTKSPGQGKKFDPNLSLSIYLFIYLSLFRKRLFSGEATRVLSCSWFDYPWEFGKMSPFSPSPALPPTERFSGRETKTGVGKVAQIEAVLIRRDYPPPFGKMNPFSRPLPPPNERFSRGETLKRWKSRLC